MNTRKLTLTALLTAIALCIFTAEAQLPSLTAIPGIKLGLANVVTVFAMYALGPGLTLCIVLVRVTLGCIATGQMMAFLFSMTGGLLAFCVSALLRRWFAPEQMWVDMGMVTLDGVGIRSGAQPAVCFRLGNLTPCILIIMLPPIQKRF